MKKTLGFTLLLILFKIELSTAQVAVVPQVVFIDNQTRSGSITVLNQQDVQKEVEVSLKFGYIGFDSLGRNTVIYDNPEMEKKYSILPYTSVYPKKFILEGRQQQVVKFLIKSTTNLPEGTYWARIITSSKDVTKQIDSVNIGDSVRIGLSLRLVFITALIFQKGKINTTVDISSITTRTDSANLNIYFSFKRGGNSPFFGTVKVTVFNSSGNEIENRKELLPVYFDSEKSFSFNKKKFASGNYKVQITLTNEQADVPEENKIKFDEVTKSFNFKYD